MGAASPFLSFSEGCLAVCGIFANFVSQKMEINRDVNISGKVSMEDVNGVDASYAELAVHGVFRLGRVRRYDRYYFVKSLVEEVRHDPFWRRVLRKEFNIMLKLQHPHVAQVVEFLSSPHLGDAILMEYIAGRNLGEWLAERPTRRERQHMAHQLLDTMNFVHRRQVVHRDLKPENILVANDGDMMKLIDFGLSDSQDSAVLKRVAGNSRYSAPEQQEGVAAGTSADVFALGRLIADLHLGLAWSVVARRACREDASRRYADAGQIAKGVRAVSRMFWCVCVAVTLVVGVSVIWFSYRGAEDASSSSATPGSAVTRRDNMSRSGNDSLSILPEGGAPDVRPDAAQGEEGSPSVSHEAALSGMREPVAQDEETDISAETPSAEQTGYIYRFQPSLDGIVLPEDMYRVELPEILKRQPGYGKHTIQEVADAYCRDYERWKAEMLRMGFSAWDRMTHGGQLIFDFYNMIQFSWPQAGVSVKYMEMVKPLMSEHIEFMAPETR